MRRLLVVLIVAGGAIAAGALVVHHFNRGHPLTGYEVAGLANAGSCDESGYQIENRLDGSKATVYDCWTRRRGYFCVTVENGLARNVTADARLLFSDVLGGDRPRCVKAKAG